MSRLPSRSNDHGQGFASGSLFVSHSRHVMIDRLRRQIALPANSTPSSQRSGLASWPSENPEASRALPMLPCAVPYKTSNYSTPFSSLRLPTSSPPYVALHSPSKTHRTRTVQRFSPMHF